MPLTFELGPIRPPSEAGSALLRVNRGCPWNRCAFCRCYRGSRFSVRRPPEVLRDIGAMRALADRIEAVGPVRAADGLADDERECLGVVAFWLRGGPATAFLQDADALAVPSSWLEEMVVALRAAFPAIDRVTAYARADSLCRRSAADLAGLHEAGLDRLHCGMESGSAAVLDLVRKGVTPERIVTAGRAAVAAGFELSEYYMPGLGGAGLWEQNGVESARAIVAVNPHFIRIRTAVPVPGTPLADLMAAGVWRPAGLETVVREIRLFLQGLTGATGRIVSDHAINLLEEIEGRLPDDLGRMVAAVDRYLEMPAEDRELFAVGRWIGRYRTLNGYCPDADVAALRRGLIDRFGAFDDGVTALLARMI